jgi:multidrug efflux system membrane fusion protein
MVNRVEKGNAAGVHSRRRFLGGSTTLLLVLAFAAAIGIHLIPSKSAVSEEASPAQYLEIQTTVLRPEAVPTTVEISGFLRPHRTVRLAMEETGRVAAKPFEEGAEIAAGDLIVGLDRGLIEAELAESEALLAEVERTQVLTEERVMRARALSADRAISQDELDEREHDFNVANAAVANRRARRDLTVEHLERHRLSAPMGGTLTEIDVEIGSHVGAGEVIGRLDDLSVLEIELSVAPEVRTALRMGDPVNLWPDTEPEENHMGSITRLADVADEISHKFEVEIRVDNGERVLLAGAPVRCRLPTGDPRTALLIPDEWTTEVYTSRSVYRVIREPDQTPHVELVQIDTRRVREAPGLLEVLSGLAPGDEVVTERMAELSHGMRIVPSPSVRFSST